MRVIDYADRLDELREKRAELQTYVERFEGLYIGKVLERELDLINTEIDYISNITVEPIPFIVKFYVQPFLQLKVGEQTSLNVTGTLSNGTVQDVTKTVSAKVHFTDFDLIYNNKGFITEINADNYITSSYERRIFTISKTNTGFHVQDNFKTQGLQVILGEDGYFHIADGKGKSLGIVFKTDGNEEVGDNWIFEIHEVHNGLNYISLSEDIVTVDRYGNITAKEVGTATIVVQCNNGKTVISENVEVEVVEE